MFVHLWYRPMVHVPVWYVLQGALLGQEGDLVRLWIETAVRLKRVRGHPGPVPPPAFYLWPLKPLDSALMFDSALLPPLLPPM